MLTSSRNQRGLPQRKIAICEAIWEQLNGNDACPLDVSTASEHGSRTKYNQVRKVVYLGANVEPGIGTEARVRMSEMACLAHELAHAERHKLGYDRPDTDAANAIDEAEASLHASFMQPLSISDRNDLVEDARDQIIVRLSYTLSKEENNEN